MNGLVQYMRENIICTRNRKYRCEVCGVVGRNKDRVVKHSWHAHVHKDIKNIKFFFPEYANQIM